MAAHTPRADANLRRRASQLAESGYDVSYHGARETADLIGSSFYHGSQLDRRAFAVNSLTYAKGLARAARQVGVNQFCNSPVTTIKRAGTAAWRVSTPEGEVVSDSVFICTNAYSDALWPGLARTIVPVRGYTAVSRPINDSAIDRVLPQRHFLTDTRHLWSGIRKLPGNRLHLGTGGSPLDKSARADLAGAQRRLKMVFPDLGAVEWENHWSGMGCADREATSQDPQAGPWRVGGARIQWQRSIVRNPYRPGIVEAGRWSCAGRSDPADRGNASLAASRPDALHRRRIHQVLRGRRPVDDLAPWRQVNRPIARAVTWIGSGRRS